MSCIGCQCKERGCHCDQNDALNRRLVCGFCESGVHWSKTDAVAEAARVNRTKHMGYLKLIK